MNYIYYFSGTGNSLQIANDMGKGLGNTEIKSVAEYKGELIEGDTLGIVFPVYMWGIPLIIDSFLRKIEISENIYVYAISNYGGLPGKALDQCKDILENRNIELSAGFMINMPGNYIMGYEAFKEEKQNKLFKKEAEKIKEILLIIKERKKLKIEKSYIIIDRLLADFMYKGITKFHESDAKFTVDNNCSSCGKCEKDCPVKNIKMVNGKPRWQHKCEMCLKCVHYCPNESIDYEGKVKGKKRYRNPNFRGN